MALEESVTEMELTVEQVRESPLELLNAEEEELRRFLTECIEQEMSDHPTRRQLLAEALAKGLGLDTAEGKDATVAEQTDIAMAAVDALRGAFAAADREGLDPEELAAAAKGLDEAWTKLRPASTERVVLFGLEGGRALTTAQEVRKALADAEVGDLVLRRIRITSHASDRQAWFALEPTPGKNTWEQFMALVEICWEERLKGEVPPVLVCPHCGRIQPRTRSDQTYCSDTCRKLAWERRQK